MNGNSGNFKAKTQDIVFIAQSGISTWVADPGHPDSADKFIAEARLNGWPIWSVGNRSYVFAVGASL